MDNLTNSGLKLLPGTDTIKKYYVDKLGTRFWISSLIPSILFLLSFLATFTPYLQLPNLPLYIQIITNTETFLLFPIVFFVLSIFVSLWLYFFQNEHIQIYAGDTAIRKAPFFTESQKRKASKYVKKISDLEQEIRLLQKRKREIAKNANQLHLLKANHYTTVAEYDRKFPQNPDDIMPTRFGNILKATQWYSADRYGMDPGIFWSRLIYVIPPTYKEMLDDEIDTVMFFVNMSILFSFLGTISIVFSFFNSGDFVFRYLTVGVFSFLCAIVFYNSSLKSLHTYGELVRSSYDLFRLELLKQLKLKQPNNSWKEYETWKNLGELILLGRLSLEFEKLEYQVNFKNSKK